LEMLTRTKKSTVFVTTISLPVNGKRRYKEELPDRLQPATKDAFNLNVEVEEEIL
jgi:hypothetical protein